MPVEPKLQIIEVRPDNVDELPCCGIKDRTHEGWRRKAAWIRAHFEKGLRARILQYDGRQQVGYIEAIPGEYAWRGVEAKGYLLIHCLWVFYKRFQNRGNGRRLIQSIVDDAAEMRLNGTAVVARKSSWSADSAIFLKSRFQAVDSRPPDYELLVKKLRTEAPNPRFLEKEGAGLRDLGHGLTLVRAGQCPHTIRFSEKIAECARTSYRLDPQIIDLQTHEDAQNAPTPYAAFSILLDGSLLSDHQISATRFRNLMSKRQGHPPD